MNSKTSRLRARGAIYSAALLGTASFMALAAGGAAQAQAPAPAQPQAQASATPPEQVLITGSLIRGTVAVGVPVSTVTPLDFVEAGKLSVTEIQGSHCRYGNAYGDRTANQRTGDKHL